jgi:hypothetical protein
MLTHKLGTNSMEQSHFEKLIVGQLVKKFPRLFWSRKTKRHINVYIILVDWQFKSIKLAG